MIEELSDVTAPEDAVTAHLRLHLKTLQDDIDRLILQSYRLSLTKNTPEYNAPQHARVEMFLREAIREKKMFNWALRVHKNLRIVGNYTMRTMTPFQINLYLVCAYPVCSGGRRFQLEEEVFWDIDIDELNPLRGLSEMCEAPLYFIDRQAEPGDEWYYKNLRF